jgi:hypothetical protein
MTDDHIETRTGIEVWSSDAWQAEAIAWLDEQLAAAGLRRTGDVEHPHVRAWATVLRAPTTGGVYWMKATSPSTAFEVGLYDLFRRETPGYVLEPLAVDVERSWFVLPDGGPPLAEELTGADLVDALVRVAPQYGEFQRALAPSADELLELGVADMRADIMPTRFDEACAVVRTYVEGRGDREEQAAFEQAEALRPTFVRWCEELGSAPGAPSLDHNDLHGWNILLGEGGSSERARFYDWGDGVVAHPFASMLVALGWLRDVDGVDGDDRQLHRVRDAYLEAFGDVAPHAELVEALQLACQVGKAARALTWARAVEAAGEAGATEFAASPFVALTGVTNDSYLGDA